MSSARVNAITGRPIRGGHPGSASHEDYCSAQYSGRAPITRIGGIDHTTSSPQFPRTVARVLFDRMKFIESPTPRLPFKCHRQRF